MQLGVGGHKQTYKTLTEISWLYYFIQSMKVISLYLYQLNPLVFVSLFPVH